MEYGFVLSAISANRLTAQRASVDRGVSTTTPTMMMRVRRSRCSPYLAQGFNPLLASMAGPVVFDLMTGMGNPYIQQKRQQRRQAYFPRGQFAEDEDEFVVRFELPGFSRDNIEMKITGDVIKISGEERVEATSPTPPAAEPAADEELKEPVPYEDSVPAEETAKSEEKLRANTVRRSFERQFTIPKTVDREGITAAMKDGVLTIKMPKLRDPAAEPKPIPIN